jgi:hypothetical protein
MRSDDDVRTVRCTYELVDTKECYEEKLYSQRGAFIVCVLALWARVVEIDLMRASVSWMPGICRVRSWRAVVEKRRDAPSWKKAMREIEGSGVRAYVSSRG